MAQEKEDFSPSLSNNSDEEDDVLTNGNNTVKPDLGFENVNFTNNANDQDGNRSDKKNTSQIKKEESSFSFKHFLKRDLSLPSTSVNNYEATGAKPKIYSNSFHPSLGKLNIAPENGATISGNGNSSKKSNSNRNRDSRTRNASSDSSVDPHSTDHNNFSRQSHSSSDTLGMPSLPDFVQDHLLLEQAYLGTDTPLIVDLDKLPDFTINSNSSYNCTNSPDWGGGGKLYETCDLNAGSRLTLDLTDTVDRHHQQSNNAANHMPFPLDLPQHAAGAQINGGESLQLPDFLPTNAGEASAEAEEHRGRDQERCELETERRMRLAAQRDLRTSQQEVNNLRLELAVARAALSRVQTSNREVGPRSTNVSPEEGAMGRTPEEDSLIASLRSQVEQLRVELRSSRQEVEDLQNARRNAARSLVLATNTAETSLRDLLSGLDQVRGLANSMDPSCR